MCFQLGFNYHYIPGIGNHYHVVSLFHEELKTYLAKGSWSLLCVSFFSTILKWDHCIARRKVQTRIL